jgi:hypothetical protein
MSDLLEKAVDIVPAYLADLLRLIQQPKQFVGVRVSGNPNPLGDAPVFLSISFLLGWIASLTR